MGGSALALATGMVTLAISLYRGLQSGAYKPIFGAPVTRGGQPGAFRLLTVLHAAILGVFASLFGRAL
jgi:hypothetical protein